MEELDELYWILEGTLAGMAGFYEDPDPQGRKQALAEIDNERFDHSWEFIHTMETESPVARAMIEAGYVINENGNRKEAEEAFQGLAGSLYQEEFSLDDAVESPSNSSPESTPPKPSHSSSEPS